MFTCGDCAEHDCEGYYSTPESLACDRFTQEVDDDEMKERFHEMPKELQQIYEMVAELKIAMDDMRFEIDQMQAMFNAIVATVVRESNKLDD